MLYEVITGIAPNNATAGGIGLRDVAFKGFKRIAVLLHEDDRPCAAAECLKPDGTSYNFV